MTRIRLVLILYFLVHGCPQSCMQNPVKGLLEVYEDIVEVLLVLEIFLTEDLWVEDTRQTQTDDKEDYSGIMMGWAL